jgi:outer membrane protein assembly factor BamB
MVIRNPAPEPEVISGSKVTFKKLWSRSYDADEDLPTGVFRPALVEDRIYIATNEGEVAAIDLTGKELWTLDLKQTLSAGIAASAKGSVIVSRSGDVIAIDATGKEMWRQPLGKDIIQVPLIHNDRVYLQASNSSVFALDMSNGEIRWQYKSRSPSLTLRGTNQPLPFKDRLLVSLDSGSLVALKINTGEVLWERKLQVPKGTNEFERIIDLDGRMTLQDNIVFVPGYQGYLTAVEAYTGQILWQKELSSAMQPAFSVGRLYVADSDSKLLMLDYRSGEVKWQTDQFEYRDLMGPSALGLFIISSDMSGHVYVIDKSTAEVVAKMKAGKAPIQLVTSADRLYIQSANGKVKALELKN